MAVLSANATASDVLSASTPLFANRFQPLEGLPHDEETKPLSKFQAHGVYKPPHMRTPSEPVASITGSDTMANNTSAVHPTHGSSLNHERRGIFRSHTPHTTSTPGSAKFGYGEAKKKIHEELLNLRKLMGEMEMMQKKLLEEEPRFEREILMLRSAGLVDEEIKELIGWTPANFPSRPQSAKPIDVNDVNIDLGRVDLGSEQGIGRLVKAREKKPEQQVEEELANKTPIPGGPMYSSANHPRGMHQTGQYGHSTLFTTPANNMQRDTFMHQTMNRNEQVQAYPGATGRHGPPPSGSCQAPGQIYQTTPGRRFNSSVNSLPPRFRQPPAYHQPTPLHYQNVVQNRPRETAPVDHPVSWPPVLSQARNPIQNHTFRPACMPPPPRPYYYGVDLFFDFERVAFSSNCNRDFFVKTYCNRNGFPPSQAAWAAWASMVEKVKCAQQYKCQNVMDWETRERYGAGSRLSKWCPNLMGDLPGSEPGYSSSSSDASTKVASSRTSEAGDEENMALSIVGPNRKQKVEVPRVQKRWKDVTDKTWAFGEPPRSDDLEHYMTHTVEKVGWQVRDPQPE